MATKDKKRAIADFVIAIALLITAINTYRFEQRLDAAERLLISTNQLVLLLEESVNNAP